jgi:hypothetical protein
MLMPPTSRPRSASLHELEALPRTRFALVAPLRSATTPAAGLVTPTAGPPSHPKRSATSLTLGRSAKRRGARSGSR